MGLQYGFRYRRTVLERAVVIDTICGLNELATNAE